MKMHRGLLALTIMLFVLLWPGWAFADQQISPFHDQLAPYGTWIQTKDMGLVWSPNNLPIGWRPYSHGHWVRTNEGNTWIPDEEWGWITFHYGRWIYGEGLGWVWIPGDVWSPGWVAWREGDGMVGWSALPPDVGWEFAGGFGPWFYDFDDIDYFWWTFVDADDFFDRDLDHHIFRVSDNDRFLRRTHDVTRFRRDHDRIIDESFRDEDIRRLVHHDVPQVKVADLEEKSGRHWKVDGDELFVSRPIKNDFHDSRAGRTETMVGSAPNGQTLNQQILNHNEGWIRQRNDEIRTEESISRQPHASPLMGWTMGNGAVNRGAGFERSQVQGSFQGSHTQSVFHGGRPEGGFGGSHTGGGHVGGGHVGGFSSSGRRG